MYIFAAKSVDISAAFMRMNLMEKVQVDFENQLKSSRIN